MYDYSLNANLNTQVYGMYNINKGKVLAIRHVMKPSVGISYRPDFGQEKFSFYETLYDTLGGSYTYSPYQNGIYGIPGSGKSGNINMSLKNNLEMKVKTMKDSVETTKNIKIFEYFNLNTAYNVIADSLRWSPLSTNGSVKLGKKSDITFRGYFDPYITDTSGIRQNTYMWDDRKKMARFTRGTISTNLRLKSKNSDKKKASKELTPQELAYVNDNLDLYVDFDAPWSLNFSHQLNYARKYINYVDSVTITQTLRITGDVKVTENWKITVNSGYDFTNKKLSMTRLNIFRNLHCWEMRFSWIPFGTQQSYTFNINVKASVIQDLKLSRKKTFTDF